MRVSIDLFSDVSPSKDHWLNAGAGLGGVHYAMIFGKDEVRVEFVLAHRVKEKNKAMFDFLFSKRDQIEKEFGAKLHWRQLDDNKTSLVVDQTPIYGYDKENWPQMIDWLVTHLRRLETTFDPYIDQLRQLLKSQVPKSEATE